ncbi:MAG: hypothetical protein MUP21_03895 [Dehalococcoidia bacterium]|nr:hypothetical protein [Dehalococcoidia bacterium]
MFHAACEEKANAGDYPHGDHHDFWTVTIQCPAADDGKQRRQNHVGGKDAGGRGPGPAEFFLKRGKEDAK